MKIMSKTFIFAISLFIVVSCLLSCTNFVSTSSLNPTESITEWRAQISPVTYSSIEDLLKVSSFVIIGTVTKILPTIRVRCTDCVPNKKGFGMQQDSLNVTSAYVQVEQVIKGSILAGETFRIDQDGGFAEGVMETISPYRYLEDGKKYLMFVRHSEDVDISKYFTYSFTSIFDGFMAIVSGKVYPWDYSKIFLEGTSVDDAILAMQPKAIVIPAEMPDDFAIYFAFGVNPKQKNVLDAYPGGGITKDLIENGTHHSEFSIEKSDLAAIYKKMQELSLLGLNGKIVGGAEPPVLNNEFQIKYRINGNEWSVSGDSTTTTAESPDARNLEIFRRYLEAFMMNTDEYKHMPTAAVNTTITETRQIYVDYAPVKFSSEEELVDRIKSGFSAVPDYKLETLEFYFRPKNLLDNSTLIEIIANNPLIAYKYKTDSDDINTSMNIFQFVWYRDIPVDNFKEEMGVSWKPMVGHENFSFKTIIDHTGKEMVKMICWTQDGFGFHVNAPLWFTEEDALEYCVAEKVQVK